MRLANEKSLLELVGQIYDAALEPQAWPSVLERLAADTGSAAVMLTLQFPTEATPGEMHMTSSVDPAYIQSWNEHYWKLDPWRPFNCCVENAEITLGRELVPHDQLVKTEFYNDWMRPQKYLDTFAANLSPATANSAIAGFRSDRDDYRDDEVDLVRALATHFRRAAAVYSRLRQAEREAGALKEALDRFSTGVLVLDSHARALYVNGAAQRILAREDGLAVRRGELAAARTCDSRNLRQLLVSAARTGNGHGLGSGGQVMLARPSGRRALVLTVSPIRSAGADAIDGRAAALVFVVDPDQEIELPQDALRGMWKLTRSEARAASMLAAGLSVEEISDRMSVQANTVRAHLKQVFAKTETKRQAELVALLLRTVEGGPREGTR